MISDHGPWRHRKNDQEPPRRMFGPFWTDLCLALFAALVLGFIVDRAFTQANHVQLNPEALEAPHGF